MTDLKKILLLNGPNLNLLGTREPDIYGTMTLQQIENSVISFAKGYGVEVRAEQSNYEGVLIELLQQAALWANAVVFNPGGYGHTSIALRDTIVAIGLPVIEVHISNIHAREPFRQQLLLTPVCQGQITGLGWQGYLLAVEYFLRLWKIFPSRT